MEPLRHEANHAPVDAQRRAAGRGGLLRAYVDDHVGHLVRHGEASEEAGRPERLQNDMCFFAVFRFEDGFLVEHWRFSTPLAPLNRSGHTQTDGPTEPDRGQDTDSVKAVVRDYYETVHVSGQHNRIGDYMADGLQIRHEPGV